MAQPERSGQWPGPPAPAERRADEVRENYAETGTPETAPEARTETRQDTDSEARQETGWQGESQTGTQTGRTDTFTGSQNATEIVPETAPHSDGTRPRTWSETGRDERHGETYDETDDATYDETHDETPEQASAARVDEGLPGSGPDDIPMTLLEPAHAEDLRRRWDVIKASFVDDPQEAVKQAEQLADEVVTELTNAVEARRRDLAERRAGVDGHDEKARTEYLRVVLNGYQSVLGPALKS